MTPPQILFQPGAYTVGPEDHRKTLQARGQGDLLKDLKAPGFKGGKNPGVVDQGT
jgi:hypothetical protein